MNESANVFVQNAFYTKHFFFKWQNPKLYFKTSRNKSANAYKVAI